MLTLADIDRMFPETNDGSIYSDLHKDVYGFRPKGVEFESLEDFDVDFQDLIKLSKVAIKG